MKESKLISIRTRFNRVSTKTKIKARRLLQENENKNRFEKVQLLCDDLNIATATSSALVIGHNLYWI